MAMEVTQILLNAQSIDSTVRQQAEENLNQFQEQNLPGFFVSLAGELANGEKPAESRKLAGLILKNALDAKEQHRRFELVQRWLNLDVFAKAQIKAFLLQTLSSPAHEARSTASQVIAKVAGIELPHQQWPELLGALLSNIHQLPAHTHTKQATLKTLGYICEEVSPEMVEQGHVNTILTAVVQVMNSAEANNNVRLAATRALCNALGCAPLFFSIAMVFGIVMQVVREATLSPNLNIRQSAFECLVAISSKYYDRLAPYMDDILNITAIAMEVDEEPVALQAIEFWSSICDEEINRLIANITCLSFIEQALPVLVPSLVRTLPRLEEDQDQDEWAWNIAMAGCTCLRLVRWTVLVHNLPPPPVLPFLMENVRRPDGTDRRAVVDALFLIFRWQRSV